MASKITVTVKYDDGSKQYTEEWNAADTNPSADVIKQVEQDTVDKWLAMGNGGRGLVTTIKVRQVS